MRVIAGSARGRQLATFAGRDIRPTPDRVREALFSIIFSKIGPLTGCRVLDLFAGSGALGIEALSRGAGHVWFLDHSRQAIGTISENLQRCRLAERATVQRADLWQHLPALPGPFTLIFADPPYGADLVPRLLEEINRYQLLAGNGLLSIETAPDDEVPDRAGSLRLLERRRYGSTLLHFFHFSPEVLE